jgi:hypothetical protein
VKAAIETAAAASFVFFVLLIVALGQLTEARRLTAIRYIALAIVAACVLIDWLLGATGWVIIEGIVLVVAIPFGIVHLVVLLVQESRQG